MLRLIALGLAFGAGFQAWRNFPADGPLTADSAALVFGVGVLCAFFGGYFLTRRGGGASATAVATAVATSDATAQATNSINLVVMTGQGAGASPGVSVPDPVSVSWYCDRPALPTIDDLDGFDMSDFGVVVEEFDA